MNHGKIPKWHHRGSIPEPYFLHLSINFMVSLLFGLIIQAIFYRERSVPLFSLFSLPKIKYIRLIRLPCFLCIFLSLVEIFQPVYRFSRILISTCYILHVSQTKCHNRRICWESIEGYWHKFCRITAMWGTCTFLCFALMATFMTLGLVVCGLARR